MTFKTAIRGMRLFFNDDGTRVYRTLALAEVYIPELHMTLHDVRLVWSPDRGFVAHAPSGARQTEKPIIQWYHRGEFARDLTDKLRDMYARMGGEIPEEVSEKEQAAANAKRRISEKPQPIERRVVPATFSVHEWANDNEAVDGLARTLSVEQEEALRVLG
ncbi:hypothetical protein [Rhizobium mesoamericanum]|uniref:hypothetical protein n=1 Tax=Rhizobium mesoamericanum TaxID=1079800 RepID=UPI0004291914|nr:hypothetical protein [Rhizobium mesoamericanum]